MADKKRDTQKTKHDNQGKAVPDPDQGRRQAGEGNPQLQSVGDQAAKENRQRQGDAVKSARDQEGKDRKRST